MSIQNLLNQFLGTQPPTSSSIGGGAQSSGLGDVFNQLTGRLPGGFAGGAATGGIIALLIGSKTGRKIASNVVTYGGAALLGGLAYNAIKNWKQNGAAPQDADFYATQSTGAEPLPETQQSTFEVNVIKAMIAAAKADGHIDSEEQRKIFEAVNKMDLNAQTKGLVFDLLQQDISVQEIASSVTNIQQKSEIYLASYLVIDPDEMAERIHLVNLAEALDLPISLTKQLEAEVKAALK